MQYFTGSKDHNVALRTRAVKMGFKLNEYGLFRTADESRVAGETEEEVYAALGLRLDSAGVAGEQRRDRAAPTEHDLPDLVEAGRHPRRSAHAHHRNRRPRHAGRDGRGRAQERGYEYIAITDHSKALAMANGLDEQRAVALRPTRAGTEPGRAWASACSPGSSATSCAMARMDLADDALAELDLVIGSVHSHMNLEAAEMTDRLLRALECPSPANSRPPHRTPAAAARCLSLRFRAGRSRGGAPRRAGSRSTPVRSGWTLSATLIRAAKAKGARFTISTDAHHPKHLRHMRYGVDHRAARLARTRTTSEYAAGGTICRRHT